MYLHGNFILNENSLERMDNALGKCISVQWKTSCSLSFSRGSL